MIYPSGIEVRRTAFNAMHRVIFFKKKFRKIGAVLAGYA
jgi:hypothetical protein